MCRPELFLENPWKNVNSYTKYKNLKQKEVYYSLNIKVSPF